MEKEFVKWHKNDANTNEQDIVGKDRDDSPFSISAYIKTLVADYHLRLIGDYDDLMFYPSDVAAMLKIKRIDHALSQLSPCDIATDEQRKKANVVTKRVYRGKLRTDHTIKLLTESGLLKLIGRSCLSDPEVVEIQDKLYRLLKEIRLSERAQFIFYKEENVKLHQERDSFIPRKHQNGGINSTTKVYVYTSKHNGKLLDIIPKIHQDDYRSEEYDETYEHLIMYTSNRMTLKQKDKWDLYGHITGDVEEILYDIDGDGGEDGDDYVSIPVSQAYVGKLVYTIVPFLPSFVASHEIKLE